MTFIADDFVPFFGAHSASPKRELTEQEKADKFIMEYDKPMLVIEKAPTEPKKKAKFQLNKAAQKLIGGDTHIMLGFNNQMKAQDGNGHVIIPLLFMFTSDKYNKNAVLLNKDGSFHSGRYHELALELLKLDGTQQHVFVVTGSGTGGYAPFYITEQYNKPSQANTETSPEEVF